MTIISTEHSGLNRSWGPTQWKTFHSNRYLGWIVLLELILLATVLVVPAIGGVFSFATPTLLMLAAGVLAFLAALFWLELIKRLGK